MRFLDLCLALLIVVGLAVVAELLLRKEVLSGVATAVDGDSLQLPGTRIRLEGIDAPELHQTCTRDGRPWDCGAAAQRALAGLVALGPVFCTSGSNDRYGRAVARCTREGVDLGERMVRDGLALNYGPGDYGAAEAEARAARRGLWAGEFQRPADFRAAHPRSP